MKYLKLYEEYMIPFNPILLQKMRDQAQGEKPMTQKEKDSCSAYTDDMIKSYPERRARYEKELEEYKKLSFFKKLVSTKPEEPEFC